MAWLLGSNHMKAADFITAQTYSELSQQFDLIELCIIAAMRDTSMHLFIGSLMNLRALHLP